MGITLWLDVPVRWNFGLEDPVLAGCGNDGAAYCNMALGRYASNPYARRILTPLVVSWMPSWISLPWRFRVLNLICLFMTSIFTVLLTRRLCENRSVEADRLRWGAWIAGFLLLLLPQVGFRWVNFYPTLVDPLANLLGLAWLLLLFSRHSYPVYLAPLVLFFAGITRESWIPVGVVSCLALLFTKPPAALRVALLGNLIATMGAFMVIARFDTIATHQSLVETTWWTPWSIQVSRGFELLDQHFLTATGLQSTLWQSIFAFGFLPFLLWFALFRTGEKQSFFKMDSENPSHRLVSMCVSVLVLSWILAVAGGNDMHRIMSAAAPGLLAMIVATVICNPSLEIDFLWLFAASVVFWNPTSPILDGTLDNYHYVFSPIFIDGETGPRLERDSLRAFPILCLWLFFRRRKISAQAL